MSRPGPAELLLLKHRFLALPGEDEGKLLGVAAFRMPTHAQLLSRLPAARPAFARRGCSHE
jgi:hypothetical protein